MMIGRIKEQKLLERLWESNTAEFIAVYGRRRVGKTYLIRSFFENKGPYLEAMGQKEGTLSDQLHIFKSALEQSFFKRTKLKPLSSWREAFTHLTEGLKRVKKNEKAVVFLDELPWLSTPRAGLLQELDHFWNSVWSKMPQLKLIVCGSAASWMLEHLVHAKGGLYNRLTQTIFLEPFSPKEAQDYLQARGIKLSPEQVTELYMAIGGIPFYLNQVEKGHSAAQMLHQVCFRKEGLLYSEFERIFPALFTHPEKHVRLIRIIANTRKGISRSELLKKTGKKSGGAINRPLTELEAAGFIQKYVPYGKTIREGFYRVIDEFTLFYFHWMEKFQKRGIPLPHNYWLTVRQSPAWASWAGYAFEGFCQKYADEALKALGISGIACTLGTWRYIPIGKEDSGAQIDLLIDRSDGIISICEIKFTQIPFSLSKSTANELERKMTLFKEKTKTRKQISLVMIASAGLKANEHSRKLVNAEITLKDFFRRF
ncbi:MAG: AAA family ATPase [Chlamydiae bacterium]|nr:AAA family ATPase [Chlamydiota bacterium]MBI3265679.1 AAA family ATPase [Chlamydiota bacterium]